MKTRIAGKGHECEFMKHGLNYVLGVDGHFCCTLDHLVYFVMIMRKIHLVDFLVRTWESTRGVA